MEEKYKTKTIEHLGLVAGMIDELRIVEIIDQEIKQDFDQRQVTVGQAVKAMILNGLGFANRRLYLATHFFENKPTEQLIGKGGNSMQTQRRHFRQGFRETIQVWSDRAV